MADADHRASFNRYARGKSIPFNRPVYGYVVTCSCGWTERVNGTKRESERIHRLHRTEKAR